MDLSVGATLTLDGGGNPNAVWIFQVGSALTLNNGSTIALINGANANNVFWQVGSSATIGTTAVEQGLIVALASITAQTGATLNGRMWALTAAVTLDTNTATITAPSMGCGNVDIACPTGLLDGVALVIGDRILLKNQTLPAENGVYIYHGVCVPLTRAPGWDTAADFVPGREVFVQGGTVNALTFWVNTLKVVTLGVDPIGFEQIGGSGVTSINGESGDVTLVAGPNITITPAGQTILISAAGGGAPTGDHNTLAYFNNLGNLTDNITATFNDATNSMSFGVTSGGTFTSSGAGSLATGHSTGAGSTIVSSGVGSIATGLTTTSGEILSNGNGTFAHGNVDGAGSIIQATADGAEGAGSVAGAATISVGGAGAKAFGSASNNALIRANGDGGIAHGDADAAGSTLAADGTGSDASGNVLAGGNIIAGSDSSKAFGTANGAGSSISTSGIGSVAYGQALTDGTITASGIGSGASGNVSGAAAILASGNGSLAHGTAGGAAATITASGPGSTASGLTESPTDQILASGAGSTAFGHTVFSGSVNATNDGTLAFGKATNASQITAAGIGSLAFGQAVGNNIIATGIGSIAGGNAATATVETVGDGSIAFGDGNTSIGVLSQSFGLGNNNGSYGSMMIGRYGVPGGTAGAWVPTELAFVVGNGTGVGTEANAYSIAKDGRQTTTAAHVDKLRVITGTDTLSARTDFKAICNAGAGAFVLNLPAGEQGLNFIIGQSFTNTGTFTIMPNGGNLLDGNVQAIFNTNQPVPITFDVATNTWYAI